MTHSSLLHKRIFLINCVCLGLLFSGAMLLAGQSNTVTQEKTTSQTHPGTAEKQETLVPRLILFFFQPVSGASIKTADLLLLYDSFLITMNNEVADAIFLELSNQHPIPPEKAEKTVLAGRMEADAWLWIGLSGSAASLTLEIIAWDMLTSTETFNFKITKSSLRGLEKNFWKELIVKLNTSYRKIASQKRPQVNNQAVLKTGSCQLHIKAKPNTTISGLSTTPLMISNSGELTVEVQKYRTYVLKAVNNDFNPVSKAIYTSEAEQELTFSQRPRTLWEAGLFLYNLTYPGIEVTYHPQPDSIFFRGSLTAFSWSLPAWGDPATSIGSPFLDLNVSCGINLLQSEANFFWYLTGTAALRIVKQQEPLMPNTDPLRLFLGLVPTGGMALVFLPGFQLYTEYCPVFFVFPSLQIKKLIFDLFCFNVGIRLQI